MDETIMSDVSAAQFALVLNTCPDLHTAESIGNLLVDQELAACVNIVPGITSIYRWKGQVEKEQELLLIAKTRTNAFSAVEQLIKARHPYELPEIISVPLNNGLANYLSWIDDNIVSPT